MALVDDTDYEEHYREREEGVVMDERRDNPANWLIPLLLIPVFIIVGWAANDLLTPDRQSSQFGVGGSPANITTTAPMMYDNSNVERSGPMGSTGSISPVISPTETLSPTASPSDSGL